VTQDITAHRQSEIRLRRSEELLRATTENTADTLILLDADLHVRFANKALHGMTIEQMAGVAIEQLVPAEARNRVAAKLRHVLLSGEAASYEYEDAGTAREARYFENRAVLVEGQGVGTGISLSVRDITERKRLEREILEVSGRERQRIGRDLHDGLGQELTGIALMLRGLARRLERDAPDAMESVNEIVGLVNRSIDSTRCLARGLLPVSIEQGGLLEALHSLADRSCGLDGLDVQFHGEVWPELRLDETKASHLYRIAQEALTNAARHGQASRVDIVLLVNNDRFQLKIVDNGLGMPNSVGAATGLGMKIMAYRANIIGADIEILGNVPSGTIVNVTGAQPQAATEV
jgi:PAS domain S-box-containing protein